MAAVTVDAAARNSYYSAGNIGWSARSAFAYRTAIQQLAASPAFRMGELSGNEKRAFSFTTSGAVDVTGIRIVVSKAASPADNLSLAIWSDTSNLPNASLASADNVYNGANLATVPSWLEFQFATPVTLSASTKYWLVIQRSGALDATNYYNVYYSTGDVLSGGGTSAWNGSVWSAEAAANDWAFQVLSKTPSALYQVTQDTGASPKLHMWKSTDDGANWSEQDSANAPSVNAGTAPFDACDTRSGPYLGVAFFSGANAIRLRAYNMSTDTWGSDLAGADAATAASQERSIRVSINNSFTTATHGWQTVAYTSSADDADLLHSYRSSTGTWTVGTFMLSVTSTEASLVSAIVDDKKAIDHTHRFYYDCANDDFSNRSISTGTQGTETDLDATTAADVETEHASACYQIYQASGVDTIIAAYIKSDGSIQERICTLEVTSASVSMAAITAVSAATTTAGRQLATCRFNGVNYIFASVSGTGIDYYTSVTAGTWVGPTAWKTGLTASTLSTALPIEGQGILVAYTDNGDAEVDWVTGSPFSYLHPRTSIIPRTNTLLRR